MVADLKTGAAPELLGPAGQAGPARAPHPAPDGDRTRLHEIGGHRLRLRHEPCRPAPPDACATDAARSHEIGGDLRILAESGGHVVASLRAHFADHGPFDFEAILDIPLPDACRPEIIVLSRLVVDASCVAHAGPIVVALVGEALRLGWTRGRRAAVFLAAEPLAPVYVRLAGAEIVSEPRRSPRTGQAVQALMLAPLSPRQPHLRAAAGLEPQDGQAATTAYLEAVLALRRGGRTA